MYKCSLVVLSLCLLLVAPSAAHQCIHDKLLTLMKDYPPQLAPQYYKSGYNATVHKRSRFEAQQSTAYTKMRITWSFDPAGDCSSSTSQTCGHCRAAGDTVTDYFGATTTCATDDIFTSARRQYVTNLMNAAENFFETALNLEAVSGNLVVAGTKCGRTLPVPSADSSSGVANTDFVIYVTAVPMTDPTSATVAWAYDCYRDQNGRPLVGHVNFVPRKLTNADSNNQVQLDEDVSTAVHEIAHALGFSSSFFKNGYVDMDGNKQSGGTSTSTSSELGKSVTKIVTPRVIREAKLYFACDTLDGLEVEDEGGSGTAGSHWEKRLMNQEFMNGINSVPVSYYSAMTLAYFEDTGHYTANYDKVDQDMTWGKHRGCDFVNKKCNTDSVKEGGEFCFDDNSRTEYCTHDRTARGYCAATTYTSDLPSQFQYFPGKSTTGGATPGLDYCPAVMGYSNRICVDETQDKGVDDIYGQKYSKHSRCFESNLVEDLYVAGPASTRCFQFSCSSKGIILLNIVGTTVWCPKDRRAGGADLSNLRGFEGSITCPPASALGCEGPGELAPGETLPPTPQPPETPVPAPTPQPTPAPPGFTPAPPPIKREAYTGLPELPASCEERKACAAFLDEKFPACKLIAYKLVECFGQDCNDAMISWLDEKGYTQRCADREQMAKDCQDGYPGVFDICRISSASQLGVALAVVVAFVASIII